MSKNKNMASLLILTAVLTLGMVILYVRFVPKVYFNHNLLADAQITCVTAYNDEQNSADITKNVDIGEFKDNLYYMHVSRFKTDCQSALLQTDTAYEIDGIYNNKPFRIILNHSGTGCVYSKIDDGCNNIKNCKWWINYIQSLTA